MPKEKLTFALWSRAHPVTVEAPSVASAHESIALATVVHRYIVVEDLYVAIWRVAGDRTSSRLEKVV